MLLIERDPFNDGDDRDFEAMSIDGSGNNLANPHFNVVNTAFLNIAPVDYGNGFSTPAGSDRPNPRTISNALFVQTEDIPDEREMSNLTWVMGQFLDHDLTLNRDLTPQEQVLMGEPNPNIPVPAGDPVFDPAGTGNAIIPLRPAAFFPNTGTDPSNPRRLVNTVTGWVDGSHIYGSTQERADALRSFSGGRLKTSGPEGNFLPFYDGTIENDNPTGLPPQALFVAGDLRVNENPALAAMHTLFVREHNRLAAELVAAHPLWNDEQVFQRARQINVAQWQAIVFNEYAPALMGSIGVEYERYDPNLNPTIDRTFTSAFRLGHTSLSPTIPRFDENGAVIPQGNLSLAESFFQPGTALIETDIDPLLRGLANTTMQAIDEHFIDEVRNLLFGFGPPGTVLGRDLPAINIQRGRTNGIADYNTVRVSFGLPPVTSFAEITTDTDVQATLAELYGTVDDIDLFVGIVAEDRLPDASVGPTAFQLLQNQFVRLREGDRFFFGNPIRNGGLFTPLEIGEIGDTTLAEIIRRNTDVEDIRDNVFLPFVEGDEDDELLRGGPGNDVILGLGGDDELRGSGGDDTLAGNQGDDLLDGGLGNDLLFGGRDEDTLIGGEGDDSLFGNIGDDILEGNEGNDLLLGGRDEDTLIGGMGNDILGGQRQKDILTGNEGADIFFFGGEGIAFGEEGIDEITDFTTGEDLIQLSVSTFSALQPAFAGEALFLVGTVGSQPDAAASETFIVYDNMSGTLYYNPNGEGTGFGGGGPIAILDPELDIVPDSFVLVP